MAEPCHTRVDRAVDRDAVPTQRATRGNKVPRACTRGLCLRFRHWRSLGGHDFVGRYIRRMYGGSESKNHGRNSTQFLHITPFPTDFLSVDKLRRATQELNSLRLDFADYGTRGQMMRSGIFWAAPGTSSLLDSAFEFNTDRIIVPSIPRISASADNAHLGSYVPTDRSRLHKIFVGLVSLS
jgi:hypothetical protein